MECEATWCEPAPGVEVNVLLSRVLGVRLEIDALAAAVVEILRLEGEAGPLGLSLVITDDEEVRELNLRFRESDAPTDVLAFGSGEFSPEEGRYLGDVVISYQRALAQAEEAGCSPHEELYRLVIHGVLHLLGYEDEDEASWTRMWARQEEILRALTAKDARGRIPK